MAEKFNGFRITSQDLADVVSGNNELHTAQVVEEFRRYMWAIRRIRDVVEIWDDDDAMAPIPLRVIDEILESAKYA
jgi:hypothetical protein